MASPTNAGSPTGMSPPGPSNAQLPSKKRSSTLDINAPNKRRKPSSQSAITHPLRQTSFPPESTGSPMPARSPSVDATSYVSGSVASGTTAGGSRLKKKRGRKPKNVAAEDPLERTPSLVGGKASTLVSGQGGDKDEDFEDEKEEMAVEEAVVSTREQQAEELRMRAMLVESFDDDQMGRYEQWRAAKLSDPVVKRVVNATVSQSVPQMVSTAVRAVTKLFAGEIIEAARQVQSEYIQAGEEQSEINVQASYEADGVVVETSKDMRGPLRPEHLREAWRRYRFSGESHGVGVQQQWHAQQADGVERFSTRTGKRLFK